VIETRSSAASDTDRIAYDVLYNVKLSNPNQLEVDERLVRMGQRLWTRPISTNSSVSAWLTTVHEVSELQNITRPVQAWLAVSKNSRSRSLRLFFG